MKAFRIFIVDDDATATKLLAKMLSNNGYVVEFATDPLSGLRSIQSLLPDIVMLDIRMPGMDGYSVCKELKFDPRTSGIPIVMLSSESEEAAVVLSLELGADDFVEKPYRKLELLARIKATLRRRSFTPPAKVYSAGPFKIDFDQHAISLEGVPLDLTPKEFALLSYFLGRDGRVMTHGTMCRDVWGADIRATSNAADMAIQRLRKKLGRHRDCLQAIRGIGYRFESDADTSGSDESP